MTWQELQNVSDKELLKLYDKTSENTCVGLNFYTNEIMRRSNEKTSGTMVKCTILITVMTSIILICTIVSMFISLN